MAAITWDEVTAFAPGMATFADDGQTLVLAEVNTCFNVSYFVDGESSAKLKLCRIYYAAHLATIATQGNSGAAGPVTSEMIDRLRRSYAAPSGAVAYDSLDSTAYGKMLRSLVRTTAARAPVVL